MSYDGRRFLTPPYFVTPRAYFESLGYKFSDDKEFVAWFTGNVEAARAHAEAAGRAAEAAEAERADAEAWANGTRGGEAVPEEDPAYEANARNYAETAEAAAGRAEQIAADHYETVGARLDGQDAEIATIRQQMSNPFVIAPTGAAMVDTSKAYVYVGDGSGEDAGLVPGAAYVRWDGDLIMISMATDPALKQAGVPADAKAAGDEIAELNSALVPLRGRLYSKDTIFVHENKRLSKTGAIESGSGSVCSNYIQVKTGDVVKYKTVGPLDYPVLAHFSSLAGDGFNSLVLGNGINNILEGYVTVESDGYVVIVTTEALKDYDNPYLYFVNSVDNIIKQEYDLVCTETRTRAPKRYNTENVPFVVEDGIVRFQDLSVFATQERYKNANIPVTKGETYAISGYGFNSVTSANYYPCAFIVGEEKIVLIGGGTQRYSDVRVTIPFNGTLYVNGYGPSDSIQIKQITYESDESFLSSLMTLNDSCKYRCTIINNDLHIKYKSRNGENDIILAMGNVGGNGLFNFKELFVVPNTGGLDDSFDTTANEYHWIMSGSDWFGPYLVEALQNADGDTPENLYSTGGNHRTTNSAIGGGVTAHEMSKAIMADGVQMQSGKVYRANEICAIWKNGVNAYNTSKENGEGRDVITETWTAKFTGNGIECRNEIEALEDVALKRYYGFQVTLPNGASFRFHGGNNRGIYVKGDTVNSGNNTCRIAEIKTGYVDLFVSVRPEDLGGFEHNAGYSFFTSGSKLYAYLAVPEKRILMNSGDTAYVEGVYEFY